MSRRTGRRRRRIQLSAFALPALLLAAAAGGLALLASSMGWLDSPERRRGAPPGTVAVPTVAVPIPTYTRVRLEHLIDPRTGDLRAIYLPEGSILPETLVDAKEIIGRVVATDKNPGQLFGRSDFFPPGTREGIVAGIPPGKRALRIDATKVYGIVGLGRGDRFDLVATLDYSRGGAGGMRVEGAPTTALGSQMGSTIVVEDGAVVQPLETRSIPGATGKKPRVVEEMLIAVDPEEVATLTRALHSNARIDCVPRSGRPADVAAGPREPSSSRRSDGLNVVETISGGKRSVVAVPSGESGTPPGAARYGAAVDVDADLGGS